MLLGYDKRGNLVSGASNQVTVINNGPPPPELAPVVINEIMYNPIVPDAEYVELFNTSSNAAFDLGGWQVSGLSYTFPAGSFIAPRSFLVLAKNAGATFTAHSTNVLVFDEYDGNLQGNGETLTLINPARTNGAVDVVVSKVRYDNVLPWPTNAAGSGLSLQLVDSAQDVSRVGNWTANAGWVFASRTGNIQSATNVLLWIATTGNAYVDDITLIGPGGTNLLQNGDFESDLTSAWILGTNYLSATIVNTVSHSGQRSLFLNGTSPGGTSVNSSLQQRITGRIVTNATYTLSYWCLANTNSVAVNMRTLPGINLQLSATSARVLATPGAPNAVAATLPTFPPLWLNEVQPENVNGITDNHGQREPWIELYNAGSSPIALDGLYLADNYTNLTQWSFPAGAVINAGEFKVIFADGQPEQTTASEWHTSFRLAAGAGSLALSRMYAGAPQVIDYLNYAAVDAGRSYGSFPDGQSFDRFEFFYVTPGAPNNALAAPVVLYINEWMAQNNNTLADPADGQFEDWFELYNPGSDTVDLTGYYLSDEHRLQYQIPSGYKISPHGYLLVWADNESGQNSSNRIDLHASFALSRSGESITLYAPDGRLIDSITFGSQTNDISQGRYPDGSPNIYYMTTPTPRTANLLAQTTAPTFDVLDLVGNQLTLGWGTTPGHTYRVEFTDDLEPANWQPLGPDMPATGSSLSVTVSVTSPAQRFFRIVVVQ